MNINLDTLGFVMLPQPMSTSISTYTLEILICFIAGAHAGGYVTGGDRTLPRS